MKYITKARWGKNNGSWKGGKVSLICKICKKEFEVPPYRKQTAKYCSANCRNNSPANKISWNQGFKKLNISYIGLHKWIREQKGKPTKCEHCGKDGLTGRQIHWANKDHTYKRNLIDWIRLCRHCHNKYDLINNLK